MNEQIAIERLELLFSDASNEDYPFTEEFAQAVHTAIKALRNQIALKEKIAEYESKKERTAL